MNQPPTAGLRWVEQGQAVLKAAVAAVGAAEADWTAPSALPGWTRKHVLSHLNGNAAALRNLAHWSRTGVVTPMYVSAQQRLADITAGAALPVADLLAAFETSGADLAADWAALTEEQWAHPVATAQGRTLPLSQTPWLRAREVMVHAVDLAAGVGFADLPPDFLLALIDDIVEKRSAAGDPGVVVEVQGSSRRWVLAASGAPGQVSGPLPEVAAWFAGRPHRNVTTGSGAPVTDLTPWL